MRSAIWRHPGEGRDPAKLQWSANGRPGRVPACAGMTKCNEVAYRRENLEV